MSRKGPSGMSNSNPFPNSKIKETVYHSTNASNITKFSTEGVQSNGAIFFATDEGEAELHGFNKSGANHYTYEVNVDVRNPLVVDMPSESWGDSVAEGRYIKQAKSTGHDSVVFNDGYGESFIAVFSPDQVKIKGKKRYGL